MGKKTTTTQQEKGSKRSSRSPERQKTCTSSSCCPKEENGDNNVISSSANTKNTSTTVLTKCNKDDEKKEEMMTLFKQMYEKTTNNVLPNDNNTKNTQDAESVNEGVKKFHQFWNTQPVLQDDENGSETFVSGEGPIEVKKVSDIRVKPYVLPPGFAWCDMDFSLQEAQLEVYTLLTQNYVEDSASMFRFDYSMEFLKWALQSPGFHQEWHVGVRNVKNNKLMAFISGIPVTVRIRSMTCRMAEINFLCIHKGLREKRLAPVLIKEVTRRVNLKDIWQAVYTAGVVLPTPVAQCRYYHRSINPKKLIEVGFSGLAKNTTLTQTIKAYALPKSTAIVGFRAMEAKDVAKVTELLASHLENFELVPSLDEAEVAHWILPREGVINSYVVENPISHRVTDFVSFYHLPSTIIGNEKYKTLRAAYCYYHVAASVSVADLMQDCLVMARDSGFDVFNALNLLDNEKFLTPLKFGIGDGELQFYLYNWQCKDIKANEVGIVLC